MPQTRTVLHRTDTLMVERVMSHATPMQWSPSYEVRTPRMLVTASGAATEFRMAGQTVLLDGLTLLCLPAQLAYQMRSCNGAARASIVVSVRQLDKIQPQPQELRHPGYPLQQQKLPRLTPLPDAYFLAPRALLSLRLHWRFLAHGCAAVAAVPTKPASAPVTELTQALLQHVLRSAHHPACVPVRPIASVQRAQRFMVARVAASDGVPWTLNDVADAACCSLFHLSRQFRRHLGISLHGYRQRLRLATALQRLEDGERNLAEIAYDLGYCSQSHLGSAFQRELGITPAQARSDLTS